MNLLFLKRTIFDVSKRLYGRSSFVIGAVRQSVTVERENNINYNIYEVDFSFKQELKAPELFDETEFGTILTTAFQARYPTIVLLRSQTRCREDIITSWDSIKKLEKAGVELEQNDMLDLEGFIHIASALQNPSDLYPIQQTIFDTMPSKCDETASDEHVYKEVLNKYKVEEIAEEDEEKLPPMDDLIEEVVDLSEMKKIAGSSDRKTVKRPNRYLMLEADIQLYFREDISGATRDYTPRAVLPDEVPRSMQDELPEEVVDRLETILRRRRAR